MVKRIITDEEIASLGALHDRLAHDIAPLISEFGEIEQKVMITQNVLANVLVTVLNKQVPFDAEFVAEMAIRVASYIISVAPLDEQGGVLTTVLRALPGAHVSRIKKGIMLPSRWETVG